MSCRQLTARALSTVDSFDAFEAAAIRAATTISQWG
jgi:hypothetical protein